jgi:hypothetical protein
MWDVVSRMWGSPAVPGPAPPHQPTRAGPAAVGRLPHPPRGTEQGGARRLLHEGLKCQPGVGPLRQVSSFAAVVAREEEERVKGSSGGRDNERALDEWTHIPIHSRTLRTHTDTHVPAARELSAGSHHPG